MIFGLLLLVFAQTTDGATDPIVIRDFNDGLAGVHAANPNVHVAYTAWTELRGGVWQLVRIPFDEIRPNPFFQPPDAKTGAPLDVSDVKGIAFAPLDRTSGRLAIGRLVVSQ